MRSHFLSLHRYLGLMVSLLVMIIGLTGSLLVYDHSIQPSLRQQWHQVQPRDDRAMLQQIVGQALQNFPDSQLDWLELPVRETDPVQVRLEESDRRKFDLYLNPYTLEILGQYRQNPPWMRWVNKLHTQFLVGEVGHWLVGICGLTLVGLSLTGLPLWNGWQKPAVGFKIRWQSKRPILNYDLHKVGGILAVAMLMLLSVTGSFLVFQKPVVAWINSQGEPLTPVLHQAVIPCIQPPNSGGRKPQSPPILGDLGSECQMYVADASSQLQQVESPTNLRSKVQPQVMDVAKLEGMVSLVQTAYPDAQVLRLQFPKQKQTDFRVQIQFPTSTMPFAKNTIHIDPVGSTIIRADLIAQKPAVERLKKWIDLLHGGHYGGLAVMVLYLLVGLLTTGLSLTGLLIWWQKTYGKRPKPAKA
ncbi:MAG: PepSY domain-containing protein [Acaryochloris sp. SU_5_25]|nr:PepSY domain-containing protein [Acaryochloris sp. SU_5_25]